MRTTPPSALAMLALSLALPWTSARAETCEATLALVHQLYNNTADVCPSGEPAADCTGLITRGTNRADPAKGEKFDIWTSSPASIKQDAFAASYLRRDIGLDNSPMKTTNGFFITPRERLCPNQAGLFLQCAAVADAWGWTRLDRGCGDSTQTPQIEQYCQDIGIKTGEAFSAHLAALWPSNGAMTENPLMRQCTFDLAKGRGKAGRAAAFRTFLDAWRKTPPRENLMYNEIRLSNPNPPDAMPVLAFYAENPAGKAEALANQRDYYAKTGQYRPVIDMTLPKYPGDAAQFSCSPNQMRPPPTQSTAGFCTAGRPSSPGFGSTPLSSPAQQAGQAAQSAQAAAQAAQAAQMAQAAAQAAQAAQAAAQAAQAVQAAQAAQAAQAVQASGGKPPIGSPASAVQIAQAAQAAQTAQTAAASAAQAAQAAQAAAQAGQATQAAQAAQAAHAAQGQAAAAAAAAQAAQAAAVQCSQYIESATWIKRDEPGMGPTWSLSIVPTPCGRTIGSDQTDLMYAEMYNKYGKDSQWTEYAKNYGSMRRQLVCHLAILRTKDKWNLEPRRIYVDHATSISLPSPCNPPGSK